MNPNMLTFSCKQCKHFPKGKCYWCGKTKLNYKKLFPYVYEQYLDLYRLFRNMVKFRMVRTKSVETDKLIYYIWGCPLDYTFKDLKTVEEMGK